MFQGVRYAPHSVRSETHRSPLGSAECNQQTLRNYIHYLEDSGQINREPEHRRIYDYVFDTPPGEQMLIDFGEETLSKTTHIHFICLLLRYSHFLCVYAQDVNSSKRGHMLRTNGALSPF